LVNNVPMTCMFNYARIRIFCIVIFKYIELTTNSSAMIESIVRAHWAGQWTAAAPEHINKHTLTLLLSYSLFSLPYSYLFRFLNPDGCWLKSHLCGFYCKSILFEGAGRPLLELMKQCSRKEEAVLSGWNTERNILWRNKTKIKDSWSNWWSWSKNCSD
jgi:hypothetical protein